MQDLGWDDMRILHAVARAGSFAKAAEVTGQHETTIARRIRRLERASGHVLWRGPGGGLTEEGRAILAHIEAMQAEATSASRVLSGESAPAGAVRITAVPWLVDAALLPGVGSWRASAPNVRITVIADQANLSLRHGEADIALRLGRPEAEGEVIARKLCDVPFVVAGQGDWVGYVPDMAHLPQAQWTEEGDAALALRVSDINSAHTAVRLGLGRAWLPLCLASDLPVGPDAPRSRPLWCALHPRGRHAPAVRAVVDDLLPLVIRQLQD
ncbi:MAG: LysR family transcriptional regulator [Pseudomonadota bacterium]